MSGLLLASTSAARRGMLERAGVAFVAQGSGVDENVVKQACRAEGRTAAACAQELAWAKALAVSAREPAALVLGADQMLDYEGGWLSKAENMEQARAQLAALAGRTHVLHSAAALARGGVIVWEGMETARMTMRPLSAEFIDAYLAAIGPAALQGVGCYAIEGRGIQLFERIDGEANVIMGLPLLPLLAELRRQGMVPA